MNFNLVRFLCVFVVGCFALLGGASIGSASQAPLVGSISNEGLWKQYKKRFVQPDGRVVDNGNKGISHSEGQGYGMILAVAAGDQTAFNNIYGFAKKHLGIRKDALFAWKYDPKKRQKVEDRNNATDGDILIAWALLEAYKAGWGEKHRQDADKILSGVRKMTVDVASVGLIMKPGEKGFEFEENRIVVNPSYWVFPAIESIAKYTEDELWSRLLASGEQIVSQLLAAGNGGVPDWAEVSPASSNLEYSEAKPSVFSYEAVRVPLYLLMADSVDKSIAHKLVATVRDEKKNAFRIADAATGKKTGKMSSIGYQAILDLNDCVENSSKFARSTRKNLDDLYYPATLQLMSISTAARGYPQCL